MARKRKKIDSGDVIASIFVHGLGVAALLCGLFVLWWGENQASRYYSLGSDALQSAVEIADLSRVDPALDGRLVHATGMAQCATPLEDPLFGVSAKAFTLKREVSCYQVVEIREKKKDENGRIEIVHRYKDRWVGGAVDSGKFYSAYQKGRAKPPLSALRSLRLAAQDVTLGAYRLPQFMVESVRSDNPPKLQVPEGIRLLLPRKLGIAADMLHETDYGLYIGSNPSSPRIGDVRIRLSAVPLSEVSVLALAKGGTFERYRKPGDPENVNLARIVPGAVPLEGMIEKVDSDVTGGAWITRVLAAVLAGAGMIFLPWDRMMGCAPVRLLVNGRASDRTEWGPEAVFRLGLALLLLTAGATWLMSGDYATGGTLLACGAALLLWRCIKPGRKAGGGNAH